MLQHVHLLTLTHRHAKLKEIGEIVAAFESEDKLQERLTALRQSQKVDELFYLSTCNRIILFFTTDREVNDAFRKGLVENATTDAIGEMQYLQGLKAIYHLFEVASSIDSLVVGERQILGQFRDAYARCREWDLIGDDLRIICDRVVLAAKDVYNNTRIGEKSVSIVSLAMQQLRRLKPKTDARILMIGAGQTNVLVSKFLRKEGCERLTVVNRTAARAQSLAASFPQGKGIALSELENYEEGFDIIVACTGSAEAIVTPELFHWLLAGDAPDNKIVIDLGVPADVAESTTSHYPFHYVGIEQLRALAEENMSFRREEIKRAHGELHQHLKVMENSYRQRLLERAMAGLPAEIKAVKHAAVNNVFAKELDKLDPEAQDLLMRMMTYMEKRCIGIPMKAAREAVLG
ncbi:glutamyl-tRNA reductase [Neolewinella agarilytica]|uniref:Glutamyl-tRNA reductase n=1 Tax=Neolewinella agarilytica TaxID=478744 RepID=A0A1H9G5A6_9BACT|nr:glutamyl-tRNA reductase [Neolewinella agarilytica]SEQ45233.1 glutamyl-tRNA reductase [Neolewinella agarilytica]